MTLAFDYSLVRRGKTLHFRIKEQCPEMYDDEYLNTLNTQLHSLGIKHHLESCDCPELSGTTIFIRGTRTSLDEDSSTHEYPSIAKAIEKQEQYKIALNTVKQYLASYESDDILRKINSLQQRFKEGRLPRTKSKCLSFPKDKYALL